MVAERQQSLISESESLVRVACHSNEYADELKREIRSRGRMAFIERNEKDQPRVVVFSSPFPPAFE